MKEQILLLTVQGEQQAIPFTLNHKKLTHANLQSQVEALVAELNADKLLEDVVTEVIDDACSQRNNKPQPAEYTDMLQKLSISYIDFYDEEVMIFMVLDNTPRMTFACSILYSTPQKIEEIAWDDE